MQRYDSVDKNEYQRVAAELRVSGQAQAVAALRSGALLSRVGASGGSGGSCAGILSTVGCGISCAMAQKHFHQALSLSMLAYVHSCCWAQEAQEAVRSGQAALQEKEGQVAALEQSLAQARAQGAQLQVR